MWSRLSLSPGVAPMYCADGAPPETPRRKPEAIGFVSRHGLTGVSLVPWRRAGLREREPAGNPKYH
jgi:hypothetical protein